MTNQERLDALDEKRRSIANNILANENGGMGVHDVNNMPKSAFERIMNDTEALATGGKVSQPSATTEAIKAEIGRDAEAFTKSNSTTLKDAIDETVNAAKNGITATNIEAEASGNEKVKNLDKTYDYSDIEKNNKDNIEAGEEENDDIVSEALADGNLDPNDLSGNQVEQNLLKMTDVTGRHIFTQNKDGSYTVAPNLTKKEFLEAVGGKKSNTTKNILTSLSAGLVLLGIPVPNLGKMYTNFSGENYDDLYDEYKTQQSLLREGLNEHLAEGFGIIVKGAASRDDAINKASDGDYQKADDAIRSKELGWDLKKMVAEGTISKNQKAQLEKLLKDLDKEQRLFIYDLDSKMDNAKRIEFLKLLAEFSTEEIEQFSRRMKEFDPNNSLTNEDLTRLSLEAAANIVGDVSGAASKLIGSDKKIKTFISGSRLFGRKGV